MKLVQRVRDASSKMGKGRLAYFSPTCRAIILISKEYFPFQVLRRLETKSRRMRGTVKFLVKFGKIFPYPGRGEESSHETSKLHHAPTVRNILTSRPFAGSEIQGLVMIKEETNK